MPRNNKTTLARTQWTEYHCPCGYSYTSNDMKGHTIVVKLHKRVCEIAKNCKINETLWKRTTDMEDGNIKEKIIKTQESKRF
jgi:hypothetical protein